MPTSKKDVNWNKHWKGNPTITTTVKKSSPYFDNPSSRGQRTGLLNQGQSVTYIDSLSQNMDKPGNFYRVAIQIASTYNPSAPVFYTHIDNLTKPVTQSIYEGFFKPQRFDLANQEYSVGDYVTALNAAINNRTDIRGELKDYLLALVKYADTNTSIGDFNSTDLLQLPLNKIRNDFGECLGPIYAIKRGLTSIGVNSATAKILIPSRSNEPLVDYYIVTPSKTIKVSAKSSGPNPNTLKVSSLIPLVEQNISLRTSLSLSQEYNVMKIINSYSMLQGPIQAASYLGLIDPVAANSVANLRGSNYIPNPSLFAPLIRSDGRLAPILRSNSNDFSKVRITVSQISYACDKLVVAYSKQSAHSLKFSDIVKKALANEMFFIHFSLSAGQPSFNLRRADGVTGQPTIANLHFRSKNGYDYQKDKLGFKL